MKRLLLAVSALCAVGCGNDSPPTQPTPPPATQTATRIILLEATLAYSSVQLGDSVERTLRIRNTGTATLTVTGMTVPAGGAYAADWTNGTIGANDSRVVTISFSPTEERAYSGTLTVNADHTSGTNTISISGTGTRPPGPRSSFSSGRFLIGSGNNDVVAGRYYSDPPTSACYWERQSGLGGTFAEIIANDFIAFNADQLIVDIAGSDRAFETDAECGTWFQSPRRSAQSNITPGMWLVGNQISTGVYRANVQSGCYWERLRSFSGEFSAIISNDFISSAGQQFVEIRPGDTGFWSDVDCGTWMREGGTNTPRSIEPAQNPGDIEQNRALSRERWPLRRRR